MTVCTDLTGKIFGRLIVVSRGKNTKTGRARWNCLCDCGKTKLITTSTLKNGRSKSCGCIRSELNTKRLTKHGCSGTREYSIWLGIKQRCNNQNNKEYHNYGGRRISICNKWQNDFGAFINDMGKRPKGPYTIERIDNSKGYYPGNCKWATKKENANNKRTTVFLTINGITKKLIDWCKETDIKRQTIRDRLAAGWPHDEAVFHPIKQPRKTI